MNRVLSLVGAIALLLVAPAHAQSRVQETFSPTVSGGAYRTVTTNDATNLTGQPDTASIAAVTTIDCTTQGQAEGGGAGYPNLWVTPRFSTSGATCDITIVRGSINGSTWTTEGWETITGVTASTSLTITDSGTRYGASDQLLSPGACRYAKVVVHNISGGTVLLRIRRS